ncbi:putative receptor protein kinase ZmPK1 [Hordeum vulgare]|nr:putative receptor protein kinase ZmPK1 [Hordeum vulgare]
MRTAGNELATGTARRRRHVACMYIRALTGREPTAHGGETAVGAYATYTNGSLTVSARTGPPSVAVIQLPTVAAGTVQYIRLEHDGHLRLYKWHCGSGWAPVYDVLCLFPDGGYAYPTVCGAYGVCTNDTQCSCPDADNFRRPNHGFVPMNPPPTSCSSSSSPRRRAQHRLVSLPDTAYFNAHGTGMRAMERVDEKACKKACLDDCACAATQFYYGPDAGDGFGYLQSEVFSLQGRKDWKREVAAWCGGDDSDGLMVVPFLIVD